jgi:hypothetical protein
MDEEDSMNRIVAVRMNKSGAQSHLVMSGKAEAEEWLEVLAFQEGHATGMEDAYQPAIWLLGRAGESEEDRPVCATPIGWATEDEFDQVILSPAYNLVEVQQGNKLPPFHPICDHQDITGSLWVPRKIGRVGGVSEEQCSRCGMIMEVVSTKDKVTCTLCDWQGVRDELIGGIKCPGCQADEGLVRTEELPA